MAAHFQFDVERSERSSHPVRFSSRLEGSLDQVLDRVLRNQAHIIVHSAETHAGISRIVLFEANSGAPASGVVDALAAIKARLRGPQGGQEAGK
jgi:hypothetical protein